MKEFMDFINKAVTPYHSVEAGKEMLTAAGFTEFSMEEPWNLVSERNPQETCGAGETALGKNVKGYFTSPAAGVLLAFAVTCGYQAGDAFRLGVAHTDYPCLHVKPAAEKNGAYSLLDVEVYGGPILNTWLDRPLGIAGRVMFEEADGSISSKLVKSPTSILTIPNLPIHFNRDVNKGVELKKQVDLRPLAGISMKEGWFLEYLAGECGVRKEQILDFDIYVYNDEPAALTGVDGMLLSAPRLDNQTSCYALLLAMCKKTANDGRDFLENAGTVRRECGEKKNEGAGVAPGLSIIALYDNEEVGSNSRQGADSALATMLLEKIYDGLGYDSIRLKEAIMKSRCLSLDVAHALHPNHPEKYDEPNTAKFGDGVVIKLSSTQRYAYEPVIVAEAVKLCQKQQIPMHRHVNHSDQPGGSTMGPMMAAWLPMPTLDMGVPIMAMHSSRELMHRNDQKALEKFVQNFI